MIFYWDIFPVCFVEGAGLTPFKKISEYVISVILLASVALLFKYRVEFDRTVLRWVVGSVVLTVASELCFTFYIDAYGLSNLIGHYFKILSFYFIYKAVIETGLSKPYDLLFRDIKRSEERYRSLFSHMINGFARHKVVYDEHGKPVDYVFLEVNDAFARLAGVKAEDLIGKKVTEALPGIERRFRRLDRNLWKGGDDREGNPSRKLFRNIEKVVFRPRLQFRDELLCDDLRRHYGAQARGGSPEKGS